MQLNFLLYDILQIFVLAKVYPHFYCSSIVAGNEHSSLMVI